jgi:hypothetical protein
MKHLKLLFAFLLFMGGTAAAAWAGGHGHGGHGGHGHGHVGVGVYFGPGWGWSYPYYPYSSYYPYPAYSAYPASGPVTYIEQGPSMPSAGPAEQAPRASSSWYYCHQPEGYYPYIKECPGGWQAVPAQPQQ